LSILVLIPMNAIITDLLPVFIRNYAIMLCARQGSETGQEVEPAGLAGW
jgi:hypothetical protein